VKVLRICGSASSVMSVILPEGAKVGLYGIVVLMIMKRIYAKTVNKPIMLDFTGYACEL
jgi:thiol:disulfide interchange protein DsbD